MTYEKFESIVKRLEVYNHKHPKLYRFKVFLLALTGYSYIFMILGLALAGLVLIMTVPFLLKTKSYAVVKIISKLSMPLLIVVTVIFRSLWIKMYPPKGIEINSNDEKELFNIIDEISKKLKTKKVDKVLLTDDFNAYVYQHPRLGIFGYYKNYLVIGLPLILHLSEKQFEAVLSHEIGHLSKKHGKFGNWIYRVKSTWSNIMRDIDKNQSKSKFLYKKFLEWYVPYFDAYTFVLRRAEEYEADKLAAKISGSGIKRDALINLVIGDKFISSEFWPDIYKKVEDTKEPPSDIYYKMKDFFNKELDTERKLRFLNEALKEETGCAHTHPSLRNRIESLGQEARLPEYGGVKACEKYFDHNIGRFIDMFNKEWKDNVSNWWIERHDEIKKERDDLNNLKEKESKETLSIRELFKMGYLVEKYEGINKAVAIYKKILDLDNNHEVALYSIGRIYLDKGDEKGIKYIEKAIEQNFEYIIEGCSLIYNYLINKGETEKAKKYYEKALEHQDILELAREERENIRYSDNYCEHGLSDEEVEKLIIQLEKYTSIKKAYLIRKDLNYLKQYPYYALPIELHDKDEKKENKELVEKIAEETVFPGETIIFIINPSKNEFQNTLYQIENSKIYDSENECSLT